MTPLMRFCSKVLTPHKPAATASTQVAAWPQTMSSMCHNSFMVAPSNSTNQAVACTSTLRVWRGW